MISHDFGSPADEALLRSQMPRRLSRLLRQGERAAGPWDVNALMRLHEDARFLAASRASGSREVDAALHALDATLAPLLDPPRVPDSASRERLAACLHELARLVPTERPVETPAGAATASDAGEAADVHDFEFPMSPEQWHRYVHGNRRPAPAAVAEPEPPAAPVAPEPEPAPVVVPFRAPSRAARTATPAAPAGIDAPDRILRRLRDGAEGRGDALLLGFQPIMALRGDAVAQFQALLRLRDEDGRLHAAAELVPLAERAGLLGAVDRWVLERCIGSIAQRAREGQAIRLHVTQSLNSARNGWAATRIARLLGEHDVAAQAISLELHVDEALAAPQDVARYATAVRALGCGFVLSDFEAGEATERLLDALPFNAVRLSPRHLQLADAPARAELKALVARLHERGRRVIAPRVDGAGVAAALYGAGVDYVQGNFVQPVDDGLGFDFRPA